MISINDKAYQILQTLNHNGFESYIVGGAVRDFIRNKKPHDWDIATNATPEEIQNLFQNTFDKGIKFGTVGVNINSEQFEVTTFRKEGRYNDSRHPDEVSWAKTIEEDLSRRDLRMNAIALDKDLNLVDPFGGVNDIYFRKSKRARRKNMER